VRAPGERELAVVNAHQDKQRRSGLAMGIGGAVMIAFVISRQSSVLGVPGPVVGLGVMAGAFLLAWQTGLFARAHAMMRLGSIRAAGLEATTKLNAGDFSGAREAFAELLFTARPLGAFHAVHVLMFGVSRFFEGHTKEGLELVSRAIDSQWLSIRQTREVKIAAETWRVLMLLELGHVKEARTRVDASKLLATAGLAVSAYEEKWDEVIAGAKAALHDSQFPKSGRATVAVLGRHAALKRGVSAKEFEQVLEVDKPTALLVKNPALKRFL
jgi:hypothetical protein